jgi:hypothetical protein
MLAAKTKHRGKVRAGDGLTWLLQVALVVKQRFPPIPVAMVFPMLFQIAVTSARHPFGRTRYTELFVFVIICRATGSWKTYREYGY